MCDGGRINGDYGTNVFPIDEIGPNGGNQWGPTVEESSVANLNGPQRAPYFEELPDDVRRSLVDRDLSDLQHVLDALQLLCFDQLIEVAVDRLRQVPALHQDAEFHIPIWSCPGLVDT